MGYRDRANYEQDDLPTQTLDEDQEYHEPRSGGEEDLAKIAAALAAVSVIHSQGHIAEANRQGIPARINYRELTEQLDRPIKNKRDKIKYYGAGYQFQDELVNAIDNPKLRTANAIYKLLYPVVVSTMAKNPEYRRGDIEALRDMTGNKRVNMYVLASALADLDKARNPKRNWDLSFTTVDGAPGLMYSKKW